LDANAVPVLSIFEKKLRLEVPLFQRQYVWNRGTQWEPLWEDIGLPTVGPFLSLTGAAVEKLQVLQNSKNLGDRKCLGKLRKSFVGHPDTILFWRISRERVFQHLQAITPTTTVCLSVARSFENVLHAASTDVLIYNRSHQLLTWHSQPL
jgi:hypothetical protein